MTKNVPKGNLLLRKNTILIEGAKVAISSAEISEIIRQKPNSRVIGIPYKLILFNSIDSAKVSQKRMRINAKIDDGNKRMDIKLDEINAKRIEKARKKGKKMYTKKIKEHKEIEDLIESTDLFVPKYKTCACLDSIEKEELCIQNLINGVELDHNSSKSRLGNVIEAICKREVSDYNR